MFTKTLLACRVNALFLTLLIFSNQSYAQNATAPVNVPDWALPGSPTHKQVPPPAGFHRATRTDNTKIGIFAGQSDVGGALVPGSSRFNPATGEYSIVSAGYNVWYQRDEFRFIWQKMSGNLSLAADIRFPDTAGYGDRKGFVIIRQSLNDDSKEAMVALHGAGLLHLAWRAAPGEMMKEVRINERENLPDLYTGKITRIGIEKKEDSIALYVSVNGGAMQQLGQKIKLHFDGPFYVGLGFCSHLPAKVDEVVFSNLVLENKSGVL